MIEMQHSMLLLHRGMASWLPIAAIFAPPNKKFTSAALFDV